MFRNMVTSLFKYDRIRTTDTKAKELRRWAENLVTLAKRGDLHARRQALSIVREKAVVHKLFSEVEDRFSGRSGGYTRIIRLGRRPGDAAQMSLVELVAVETEKKKKGRKKKKPAEAAKKPVEASRESKQTEAEKKASDASASDTEEKKSKQRTPKEAPKKETEAAAEPTVDADKKQPEEAAEKSTEPAPEADGEADEPRG